jgi:hypothetical protein
MRNEALTTIANGQTVSAAVDCRDDYNVVGIVIPTGFTGGTITFQGATDSGNSQFISDDQLDISKLTFNPVVDTTGAAISFTVTTKPSHITISPLTLAGVRWIKIVSGSAEAAARQLVVVMEQFT